METLRRLNGHVDVYLPDFKYLDSEHAKKYSGAEDYPEVAKRALAEMIRQTGVPQFDEQGIMEKGVIVRHLLLPGCLRDARRIVKYLYETYGEPDLYESHEPVHSTRYVESGKISGACQESDEKSI